MLPLLMRAAAIICALGASLSLAVSGAAAAPLPPIKHVWIVVLENKSYATTFGENSAAPFLAKTLPAYGELLTQYYGIGHSSLDNYIAMVSGQPPNPDTQGDCTTYNEFAGSVRPDGVAEGHGCVFPAQVSTIGDQLEGKGLTWKQYAEDMASSSTEPKTCRHPPLGQQDQSEAAKADDQYATKHNAFVYFHSIIDRAICDTNVIDLSALQGDLASASTTPTYSFITPDLCSDGHDTPCIDGRPGGLQSVNDFLQTWVPRIVGSPAYADGGLLIITFDEASGDASDCCGEPASPNTTYNGGASGNGGGRTGAVLLSPYIKPGTVNDTPYNHYSLLRSTEDLFGLSHLAYAAQDGLKPFGDDVFTQPQGPQLPDPNGPKPTISLKNVPGKCAPKSFTAKIQVTAKQLRDVRVFVDGHKISTRKQRTFSQRVSTKKLHRGKHHLLARATDKIGRQAQKSVAFRTCR
ncbi:MAG TPA: alkaline phosphatase family protein [Gaiellales bacterium]